MNIKLTTLFGIINDYIGKRFSNTKLSWLTRQMIFQLFLDFTTWRQLLVMRSFVVIFIQGTFFCINYSTH